MLSPKSPAKAAPDVGREGVQIDFSNLTFAVNDKASGSTKTILHSVSGQCRPGRLLAIMGASGAGKSTLLDVLAANVSSAGASLTGEILVNGRPRNRREFQKTSCYVQQRDVLLCSATVREAITTSALLKLPMDLSPSEKRARVEDVIRELDLTSCADTVIGDEAIGLKGISGGQKRRVSVGIELIKDPAVIFCDEPTSGLDSEMALSVMDTLLTLARKNRTVVATIHQPNSDITDLFGDFMLLSAGHMVYGGEWKDAVGFFAAHGYTCPLYRNPTDYFMSVVKSPEAAERLWRSYASELKQARAAAALEDGSATAGDNAGACALALVSPAAGPTSLCSPGQQTPGPLNRLISMASMRGSGSGSSSSTASVPMYYQIGVLVTRNWRNWLRNPLMLGSELVQYVFISLFVGLMYLNSFDDDLADGVSNRAACIWFAFAVMSFTPSYTAVTNWDKDRLLLRRELQQKQYGVTSHYLARTAVMVPFQVLQCALFVGIMYFFCGFQADAGKFFLFMAVLIMFQLISEGLGLVCAILTRQATYAIILLTFMLLLVLSFSGFLISRVPVYFVWVNKISYLTYSFAALVESELDGLTFINGQTGEVVQGVDAVPSSIDTGLTMPQNVGVLAALCAFMEIVKLVALQVAYRWGMM